MAGLWELIKHDATEERLSVHAMEAAISLHQTNALTKAVIRDKLNSRRVIPISAAVEADLNSIVDNLDAAGSVTNRLVYLHKVCSWCIFAEGNMTDETEWRAGLGI